MHILQLCHRVPFPMTDGGNIAMMNLADSLSSQGITIKMFTLNTVKHRVDLATLPANVVEKFSLEAVNIDTTVRISSSIRNLFTQDSYNIVRFYSSSFEEKLRQLLQSSSFDIILVESIFMTPYIKCIRENSKAKVVLRAHNVEHIIWQRLTNSEKNIFLRPYLSLLARRLKKYELGIIHNVDAILPITPDDEKSFRDLGCKVPMHVTPVGVELNLYTNQINEHNELALFHLGSMNWLPNLEGINWFLDDCLPVIRSKFPELKVFLAGRGFPDSIRKNAPANVICEGEIVDAERYMEGKQIMIVPLKSGGGMRVKIIQGMALGKTIISTTIGAEGIHYTNEKNILIADSPSEFLMQIEKCIVNPSLCFSIGREARELISKEYSKEAIGKGVKTFFENITTTSYRNDGIVE